MDFTKLPISQSLIKKFLYKGDERELICPYRIYATSIAKTHSEETLSTLKGHYFETLCLGGKACCGAVTDLPRKKQSKKIIIENHKREIEGLPPIPGDKTLDQVRIEKQAEIFKQLCDKYQVTVTPGNTQVPITIPWSEDEENVLLRMELDIFPTAIITSSGLGLAVIDLKLTANIESTFGEYCWGAPQYLDTIQSIFYLNGVKNLAKHINLNPNLKYLLTRPAVNLIENNQITFYYWVFGYKKIANKLIKVRWDATREKELNESINKTISIIEYYEALGWPVKPNYTLCKNCPVVECIHKVTIEEI